MNLNSIIGIFVPKDSKFFDKFELASDNLLCIAGELKNLMNEHDHEKRSDLVKKIHSLENAGDSITHDLMIELSSNFITPFDREDIHALATAMDNVADFIDASAKRIELYQIDVITEPMKQLADLVEQSVKELAVAIREMRSMKNVVRVKEALVRINSIENHSDTIYNYAIADLFKTEKDAINLIKVREILEHLETATDRCEDVADVIESIIIKNS
jgi:predicted phosphate transport protein (TIGR00153 family)